MARKQRMRDGFFVSAPDMIKRLIVVFGLVVLGVPANAASLSPFAHNAAGRSVLEFYPATAIRFNAQGRDLVRLVVRETRPDGDAQGFSDLELIVDCQLRQLAASRITTVSQDGTPPTTVAGFKFSDLKPPNQGMYQRFVVAVCDGELFGVQVLPAKSGWKHFVEGAQRALYFASGSARTIGKYRAASVRLYELGGAQLSDGGHFEARDAVWVFDCERKLGAVAFERGLARVGDRIQTMPLLGDAKAFADPSIVAVDKLTFGQAAAGSMQEKFAESVCAGNPDLQ